MENKIEKRIYTLRGVQVMLDTNLAEIYGVETKRLKEAVKRNLKRFPGDLMFESTHGEVETLRSQFATSSLHGGSRYMPFAFTEAGVAMLSSVLGSKRAIEINIEIMRAFVQFRKHHKTHLEILDNKLDLILQKLDEFGTQPQDKKRDPVRLIQDAVAKYWGLTTEHTCI